MILIFAQNVVVGLERKTVDWVGLWDVLIIQIVDILAGYIESDIKISIRF